MKEGSTSTNLSSDDPNGVAIEDQGDNAVFDPSALSDDQLVQLEWLTRQAIKRKEVLPQLGDEMWNCLGALHLAIREWQRALRPDDPKRRDAIAWLEKLNIIQAAMSETLWPDRWSTSSNTPL